MEEILQKWTATQLPRQANGSGSAREKTAAAPFIL